MKASPWPSARRPLRTRTRRARRAVSRPLTSADAAAVARLAGGLAARPDQARTSSRCRRPPIRRAVGISARLACRPLLGFNPDRGLHGRRCSCREAVLAGAVGGLVFDLLEQFLAARPDRRAARGGVPHARRRARCVRPRGRHGTAAARARRQPPPPPRGRRLLEPAGDAGGTADLPAARVPPRAAARLIAGAAGRAARVRAHVLRYTRASRNAPAGCRSGRHAVVRVEA